MRKSSSDRGIQMQQRGLAPTGALAVATEKSKGLVDLIRCINSKTYKKTSFKPQKAPQQQTGHRSTSVCKTMGNSLPKALGKPLTVSRQQTKILQLDTGKSELEEIRELTTEHLAQARGLVPRTKFDSLESFSLNHYVSKTRIEDYITGKQIGRGAYSTVRLALHKPGNTQVAFKTYERIKILDQKRRKSIIREIHLLKNLQHQNIVKFIDKIDTSKNLIIVMEYIKGKTLHTYLRGKPGKALDENEIKTIFKQIVSAVAHCHNHNISHRDLKLDNILLNENHEIKLIDFGFSTCLPANKKMKIFCGTPNYMAPEIVARKEFTGPPADIWALGVILYYLLIGSYPFKGVSDGELFRKISLGNYSVPNNASRGAVSLLANMLKQVPEDRITAGGILADDWLNSVVFKPSPVIAASSQSSEEYKWWHKEHKTERAEGLWINFDWSPTRMYD